MKKLLLTAHLVFLFLLAFTNVQHKIDSLEALLPGKAGIERSELLMQLSALYQNFSIEKALQYDLENVELQQALGNKRDLSGILNNIGVNYYMLGDYGKSLDYFEQSLLLREQFNDTINIVKTLNNLGVISQISGNYFRALEYFNRSLIYKLKIQDTLSTAKTLNNIGVIYKDLGYYDDSEKFLRQALDSYIVMQDKSGIAAAFNNLGQVFEARKIADSALVYYQKSLKLKREINDERGIGNSLNNLAMIYTEQGLFAKAEKYYLEAIGLRRNIGDNFGLASALNNLANLHLKQNNYTKAKGFFMQSNAIAKKENLHGVAQRNYEGLSKLYERSGKTAQALDYYKKYALSKDSVFNIELKQQVADLKVQYETEKSKRETEVLRRQLTQQEEIQELKSANALQERYQLIGIIILLFFGSVIVMFYLHYRNSQKLKNQLQEHNKTLELRVEERTRELQEANATKDRFFSIIAHDLKSPFNGLLGFSNMLHNEFDELSLGQKKEYSAIIKEAATDIYMLLENLLEWASSQTGLLELEAETLDITRLITEVVQAGKSMQVGKKIETRIDIQSSNMAFADEDTLKTVLRNLYSNALKFTPTGGSVKIMVEDYEPEKGQNQLLIRFADNGVGIPKKIIKDLFTLRKKVSTTGTNLETGTGLGLILCREFVEKNGGQIWLESETDPEADKPGSIFSFTLPVAS